MNTVRDRSIDRSDNILYGNLKAKSLIILHESLKNFDSEQVKIIRKVLIESVDNVIYNFLDMLEQNANSIELLISENGNEKKNIVEISDGLSGELFSEAGWIKKFSHC